jgi:isopentenyl-diphosphate Delta-isomerase
MAAPHKTKVSLEMPDGATLHDLRPRVRDVSGAGGDIEQRKKDHIDIILSGAARHQHESGFRAISFVHNALPELNFAEIDISTSFLGKNLRLPYLASSMTGGPDQGGIINRNIAEAAQAMGFAMGVGSQRISLGGGSGHGLDREVRRIAPDIALYANLGAVQLVQGMTVDDARRAVDAIEADALILHLNPLQEVLQQGGDVNWKGVLNAIEQVCRKINVPVIAKEVGAGISVNVAVRLANVGIAAIDVAGSGGSSWAAVEGLRRTDPQGQNLGELFRNWGLPTAACLNAVRAALPDMPLIASGGIANGLDGAKAIRLGANLVGQAGSLLHAATLGAAEVMDHVADWEKALRIACFCTASENLEALRHAAMSGATIDP